MPAPAAAMAPAPRAAMRKEVDSKGPRRCSWRRLGSRRAAVAATYRPARVVAVPADGTTSRATVLVLDLATRLDHVAAPARSTTSTCGPW